MNTPNPALAAAVAANPPPNPGQPGSLPGYGPDEATVRRWAADAAAQATRDELLRQDIPGMVTRVAEGATQRTIRDNVYFHNGQPLPPLSRVQQVYRAVVFVAVVVLAVMMANTKPDSDARQWWSLLIAIFLAVGMCGLFSLHVRRRTAIRQQAHRHSRVGSAIRTRAVNWLQPAPPAATQPPPQVQPPTPVGNP